MDLGSLQACLVAALSWLLAAPREFWWHFSVRHDSWSAGGRAWIECRKGVWEFPVHLSLSSRTLPQKLFQMSWPGFIFYWSYATSHRQLTLHLDNPVVQGSQQRLPTGSLTYFRYRASTESRFAHCLACLGTLFAYSVCPTLFCCRRHPFTLLPSRQHPNSTKALFKVPLHGPEVLLASEAVSKSKAMAGLAIAKASEIRGAVHISAPFWPHCVIDFIHLLD